MKEFTEDSKEQTCEIDPKKFYDEFYTMTCFNCDCPNHSECTMSCGLKNIQLSREGKCTYWNEFNKKKTKLTYEKDLLEKYLECVKEDKKQVVFNRLNYNY